MGQHRCTESQIKVRDYLRSREVKVGERLPGEREMAARLGMGRAALRSVLDGLEEEGVLLRQPQSGTTLVAIPSPGVHTALVYVIAPFQCCFGSESAEESAWMHRVVGAMERVATPAGLQLVIRDQSPTVCDPCSVKILAHEAVDRGAQAVVLINPAGPHEKIVCALGILHDKNVHPIVVSSKGYPGLASQVYFDSGWGAYMATRHLIGFGHTRIAFAGAMAGQDWFDERLAGYRNAIAAAEREPDASLEWLVCTCEKATQAASGKEVVDRWLALEAEARPTAIVAATDSLAVGIMDASRAAGVRVPDEISLVGFDNQPSALMAGLTTIERPTEALGEAVAKVALELISGGPSAPAISKRLRPVLIPRSTVARLSV